jgi:hypothetical protein
VSLAAPVYFTADHPGNPLGQGMPLGGTLRLDGESHRDAWCRILTLDPCSYCDAESATVDHIIAQNPLVIAAALGGKHSWLNYAGACKSCNRRKGTRTLLEFLARRRGVLVGR